MDVRRTQEDVKSSVVQTHATVQIIAAGKNVHYLDLLKIVCVEPTQHGNGILDGGRLSIKAIENNTHLFFYLKSCFKFMDVTKYNRGIGL